MSEAPTVTVLIPARNEERDIEGCLRAVLAQDHPHDRMEIVLVDGGSTDRTGEVARQALEPGDVRWKVVDNVEGTTPSNLNAGLAAASGEVLCRVDARSVVGPSHVRRCVELLQDPSYIVVGGGQDAVPRPDATLVARGIARALNNRLGMGLARYRRASAPGPADTVYLGAFRTADLRKAGGWDLSLLTNQDFELNQRLGRSGVVWFDPTLTVQYLPRETFTELATQYFRFGRWKRRYWRRHGARPSARQQLLLVVPPLAGVAALVIAFRRPTIALTGAVVGLATIDLAGSATPAPLSERAVAAVATLTVGASWWCGVAVEHVDGE